MIEFSHVSLSYGKQKVLTDIHFQIAAGEFVALIGGNGAGKSTLMQLTNGLLKPSAGRVMVAGLDTKTSRTSQLAQKVGFLFQNPDRQICKNTIAEEILFGLRCIGLSDAKQQQHLVETLSRFQLDGAQDPFTLSRGQRQKVALAAVLAAQPDVLLLDEPTTGLDYQECMAMMAEIAALHQQGTTVLMVSHDMELVGDFAKRVLILEEGQLIADGTVRDVFAQPEVWQNSAIVPPQITALALHLGKSYHGVFTVPEMTERIINLRGRRSGRCAS